MKRRNLIFGAMASAIWAGSAGLAEAASYAEDLVTQLASLGFSDIKVQTTLLGRIKIEAARGDGRREIVLNPRTGEILRDVWYPAIEGSTVRRVLNDVTDDDGKGDDSGRGGEDGDGQSGSGDGRDDDGREREDRDKRRDD